MRLLSTIIFFLATISLAKAQDTVQGKARVIDSDTIEIAGTKIRLHGIDAPETGQTCNSPRGGSEACGVNAVTLLMDLIGSHDVECTRTAANDKYGRVIAVCRAGGRNVNSEMVSRGLAWAYREYSGDYVACEADAKRRGVGIWRAEQTQTPWEFRRNAWNDALQVAPAGKPIKANFRRKDQCVYHTPWSRSYRQLTNMSPPNKWLANEEEALAAGCRPAQEHSRFRIFKRAVRSTPVPAACPT